MAINTIVWGENIHEQTNEVVRGIYPKGMHNTIADALNRKENHAKLEASLRAAIDECAKEKVPNIITFSGNRRGMSDQEGADNCVEFLNKVKAHAEDRGVTISMELLNSRVNHRDYMFDHMAWGVDVMKRVNSPRVRILYDIYNAQIMDGDIIRRLERHRDLIGHVQIAAVPSRAEPDEGEVDYRGVLAALAAIGYRGLVGLEYKPRGRTEDGLGWAKPYGIGAG